MGIMEKTMKTTIIGFRVAGLQWRHRHNHCGCDTGSGSWLEVAVGWNRGSSGRNACSTCPAVAQSYKPC